MRIKSHYYIQEDFTFFELIVFLGTERRNLVIKGEI